MSLKVTGVKQVTLYDLSASFDEATLNSVHGRLVAEKSETSLRFYTSDDHC